MFRPAASRLKALKGNARRSMCVSAGTSRPPSIVPLFSWLTGELTSTSPSLDFPLAGVTLPPTLPDYVEPSKTKLTTLPNGVKIASETSANPAASIGVYIDCGSVYETPATTGATHLLEKMAFKSTTNRSHLRLVREVEAIGGKVTGSASREQMGYTIDALKNYVPQMVELLVDSVRNPVYLDWEIADQLQNVKEELAEVSKNPQGLLLEALHSVGYQGPLSNPFFAPEHALESLNATVLQEFVSENYTAPRMVLAASGVDHEELLSIAEPLLSDLPRVPRPILPESRYVGGNYVYQAIEPTTHIVLAFEVPGGWETEEDAMTLTVLQMLLGGGGAFSAGGPGKGMLSRLYQRILNEYHYIQSCSAFNSIYDSTGLFGIHATTESVLAPQTVEIMAREFIEVATPGKVTQVELDRAKAATKSAVLMNLESRMIASEDIGRQILTYGERKPMDHFLKSVDAVTLEDITSIAQKLFAKPPTMASHGDVESIQSYEEVKGWFVLQ